MYRHAQKWLSLAQRISGRGHREQRWRENARIFRAVFDQAFQFMGLLRPDGTILTANRTALDFIRARESEVVGRLFWETPWWSHAPEQQERLRKAIVQAAAGELVRFETTHPTSDGQLRIIDFSLKPVMDEGGKVFMLVPEGRDITERYKLEQMKDEMLSAVSHEMRTPLTAMLGFTEYMLTNDVPAKERQDYLTVIYKESERLKGMIDNLLSLQRLRAGFGVRNFQVVDVLVLFNQVARLFEKCLNRHRLVIDCPPGLKPLLGDEVKLCQALENLVSNAVKYSTEGGTITLGARSDDGAVTLWVQDEGPGIPPEAREQIFDRFFRIDSRDGSRIGGTGLGLPLVKEIVKIHDGRVWVESAPGKGSVFYLSFPNDAVCWLS